eukprot:TRINITY_DN24256_c0_g1_i1.p1 TRINITY_DN24256_c0_g1~~TRINITY_DN24256_c0_g1_i1.p1  ORF type:complete len:348 (+),score=48.15 TRINITY_DN24256_c0_g1_i1:353-1396(+)
MAFLSGDTPRVEALALSACYVAVLVAIIILVCYRKHVAEFQKQFLKLIFLLLLLAHSLLRCIFLLLAVFVTHHPLTGDFYNTFPAAVFTSICSMLLLQWIRAASSSFVGTLVLYVLVNLLVYVLLFALYGLEASLGDPWRVVLAFSLVFSAAWLLLAFGVAYWSIRTHPWRDSVAAARTWHQHKRTILGGFWAIGACLFARSAMLVYCSLTYSNTVNLSALNGDIATPTPMFLVLLYYILGEIVPCFVILLVHDRLPVDFATTYGELQRLLQKMDESQSSGKAEVSSTADKTLCKVCYDKETNTVLLPCRHSCVCYDCAQDLQKQPKNQQCPICTQPIDQAILIYRS